MYIVDQLVKPYNKDERVGCLLFVLYFLTTDLLMYR